MKALIAFMAIVGIAGYAVEPEQPLIAYKATISKTETVWDVCSRIAGNQDNMQELVWRTMKENHNDFLSWLYFAWIIDVVFFHRPPH